MDTINVKYTIMLYLDYQCRFHANSHPATVQTHVISRTGVPSTRSIDVAQAVPFTSDSNYKSGAYKS
jgi:hypothetical protein